MGRCGCFYRGRTSNADAENSPRDSALISKYRLGAMTGEQALGLFWDETQKRYVMPRQDVPDKASSDKNPSQNSTR